MDVVPYRYAPLCHFTPQLDGVTLKRVRTAREPRGSSANPVSVGQGLGAKIADRARRNGPAQIL